jgi:type I restriction enzyme R subunit
MTAVGSIEWATQLRLIRVFEDVLGYRTLGNLKDVSNGNLREGDLVANLQSRMPEEQWDLIPRAVHELKKLAGDTSKTLYDRNRAVYDALRYGVKVKPGVGENSVTVLPIDWQNPAHNDFAVAWEVTVKDPAGKAYTKRPDLVLYINGIALGVIELKRSTVSVAEGIRQNLDNQKPEFIEHFFSTIQYVFAGNDTEGLRYGTTQTKEKYWLTWKEAPLLAWPQHAGMFDGPPNALDEAVMQMCAKERLLELIHDFVVFDAGTKKLCRHNQFFGVKAAQRRVQQRDGGILWHTQGSGKSLTMVWLAKWIRENVDDARVLIVTDRTELDDQIEKVFLGVNEKIYRTTSGADLVDVLNKHERALVCTLVHKFGNAGNKSGTDDNDVSVDFAKLVSALPPGFKAKGDLYVFVDECHRTQSGDLHKAMKQIVPEAMFIGFTGTPLLKKDKQKSIEVFGTYIHTYKFDEAVRDGVVLDLKYEARDIDQKLTSPEKVDQWFEAKTKNLTPYAKAQVKKRWGTMQSVLSSKSRLERIRADILMDMATRPRLEDGHGNAILVAGSIYEACKYYELFQDTPLAGHCAIVTSFVPSAASIKGEESGEGETQRLASYKTYRKMLAQWFKEPEETAALRVEEFEQQVKKKFIAEPGQMKLLIVVDKLLTGFDAPPATYLYIDKKMQDHGLFQAICRVNRLDGDDKDYGTIIDYKDLFDSLKGAFNNYTKGAFAEFDVDDVAGLLKDRLVVGRERLEDALEKVRALVEAVEPPREQEQYRRYFCGKDSGSAVQLQETEPRRAALYKHVSALVRAYANLANELEDAGFTAKQAEAIKAEVVFFQKVKTEIQLAAGDHVDMKQFEPAMRHLIDNYIQAEESKKISALDDKSLVELLAEVGVAAMDELPASVKDNQKAAAETVENNVAKTIAEKNPLNPKYYDKMSALLLALIQQRKDGALSYEEYLKKVAQLAKQVSHGPEAANYPSVLDTNARRSLYDNLGHNVPLALAVDDVFRNAQDDWQAYPVRLKVVVQKLREVLGDPDEKELQRVLALGKRQDGY